MVSIASIDTKVWDPAKSYRIGVGERMTQCDEGPSRERQCVGSDRSPRRAAIVTRSGSEPAFILRMT